MMNVDDDNSEPVTDLGLALAYSHQCNPARSSDSGAGVNAASRVDMTFVASDPLSELVWSPHNGLSLKCAEKKPSLFWDVGPSLPLQSITLNGITSAPTDEDKLMAALVEREVREEANLVKSPRSNEGTKPVFGPSHGYNAETCNAEEVKTVGEAASIHTNQIEESTSMTDGKSLCSPKNAQFTCIAESPDTNAGSENQKITDFLPLGTNKPKPGKVETELLSREHPEVMVDRSDRVRDVAIGCHTLGLEVTLASEVLTTRQCSGFDILQPKSASPGGKHIDLSLVIEEDRENKMKMDGSTCLQPLEQLESSAENDLQLLICKDTTDPRDKSEASPTNSKISLNRMKGKEKALSDGDVSERMSKDEDDSHESVESCNSAGLSATGKRQWSSEQQLIVGSRKVKKQKQDNIASASFGGHDSSFMNWISNMVKGLNRVNQDETTSLTLAHPSHGHTKDDPKTVSKRNTGFQTIFQSLYRSNSTEKKSANGDSPVRGSKEFVAANTISGANISPLACHGENGNFGKESIQPNEQFDRSTSEKGAGTSGKHKTLSTNMAADLQIFKIGSCPVQNKTACNLVCTRVIDERNSHSSSMSKRKFDSAESNESNPPREAKVINSVRSGHDASGRLWITRFCPKPLGPISSLENKSGRLECSIPRTHNLADFPVAEKISEAKEYSNEDVDNVAGKELHKCSPNSEPSFGFKKTREHNDQNCMFKLNSIASPKFKSSEAVASEFARRLEGLKHIITLDGKDRGAHTMTTCFNCGRSSHDLRDCSEMTESERENLIRNICSYEGVEGSPSLCIKCFQPDHWANSCPMGSTSSHLSTGEMQLKVGNERFPGKVEIKQSHSQVANARVVSDAKKSQVDVDKHNAVSSWDNVLIRKQLTPLCNLVEQKFSDAPRAMFDAIRKLRLSRTEILKCMNSHASPLHLNGFFLRLRLGKWEEGLGGTGYYVACISGEQREKAPQGSKRSISVNLGGIRCLVESQYISNQDFLEDELMAWWCATMRSGGKIPSEDHLKLKLEDRERLGL